MHLSKQIISVKPEIHKTFKTYTSPQALTYLGGATAPYLGPVATRAYFNESSAASTTGWNCRTAHYARDTITALKLVFCNKKAVAAVGEQNQGGTSTTTASIEYPAGTFTQVTFNGGSVSAVIADGATQVSDWCNVSIPKGAVFYSRRYQVNSTAILYVNQSLSRKMNVALGDAVNNNNTDQTMSGTIVDNGNGSMVPPQGIIGMTSLPTIGCIGSSRMSGHSDTVDSTGNTGYTRMFGGTFGYMDYSISGDKTATVAGSGGATRRSLVAQYCSHLWLDPGLNDLNTGATAAAVETNLAAMAAAWPGGLGKVIMNTESAWTTSTDGWTTTANQTVMSWEAQRVALNTWINALTGYNQIVAPDAYDGNGTNFQFWNNPVVGGSQFTADGVHENHATVVAMASANLFNSSLVHR